MTQPRRIRAQRDRCIGSGNCAFIAPEAFDVDSSARVVVLDDVVVDEEKIRSAIENCPTDAIFLLEER